MKNLFVISLGGSLIYPEEIDAAFLNGFKRLIERNTRNGKKFILITGGGKLCRQYNAALKAVARPTPEDLDWMGINITWANAKLVQLMFKGIAFPEVVRDPAQRIPFKQKILVGGGWKPGRSSDGAMIKYAAAYGARTAVNLSNIDYVYDKDPGKYKDAKPLEQISWKEYFNIVGNKWDPGKNFPFDPTAAKEAQKNGIKVIIANGQNFKNLQNILSGRPFTGTTIS